MSTKRVLSVLLAAAVFAGAADAMRAEELPPDAIARLGGSVFFTPGVRSVAYSPDGRLLAASGNFYGVLVWDTESGQLVKQLETTHNQVGEVFFTPAGDRLVADDSAVRVWNVADWQATDAVPAGTRPAGRQAAMARLRDRKAIVVFDNPGVSVQAAEDSRELLRVVVGERNTARDISPDGRLVAVAGVNRQQKEGRVEVWDVEAKTKLYEFAVAGNLCWRLHFTPDNKTLLASFHYDGKVHQYDMATGKEGPPMEVAVVREITMSSDGRLVAIADDTERHLFERATGKRLGPLPAIPRAFSPDGKRFATHRAGLVEVYDIATGKRVFPAEKPLLLADRRWCLSADGRRLAILQSASRLMIWELPDERVVGALAPAGPRFSHGVGTKVPTTGERLLLERTLPVSIGRIEFSPSGDSIAVAGRVVTLLSTTDAQSKPVVFPPQGAPRTYIAATSADATAMAEVEASGLIRVRSLAAQRDRPKQQTLALPGHVGRATAIEFSPDATLLASCGPDKSLRVWSLDSGKQLLKISLDENAHPCAAFSPDSSRVAAAVGDRVRVWNTADGKLEAVMLLGETPRCLAVCPDGKRLICGSRSGALHVFDLANGKLLQREAESKQAVSLLRYAPGGETLCVGRDGGAVELWNAVDMKRRAELKDLGREVRSFAFHADSGRMAAGDAGGNVAVWESATGKRLNRYAGNGGPIHILAFSPDRNVLVCRDQETFSPLDLASDQLASGRYSVSHSGEQVPLDFAFSPDGKTLATTGPSAVQLWDIASGENTGTLLTPTDCSATLAFSPQGDALAAARQGITIFRLGEDAPAIHIDKNISGETLSLAFSPDGRVLATGGRDRGIKLWDAASGSLMRTMSLRRGIGSGPLVFSADGRMLFGLDRDYSQPVARRTYFMIWETAASGLLVERTVPLGGYEVLADRRRLMSVADQGSYLIWDLQKWQQEVFAPQPDDPKELETLWSQMALEDSPAAYRAIGALAARPAEAAALIAERVKPAPAVERAEGKVIESLVAQLSSGERAAQRAASSRLRAFGAAVHPDLRRLLNTDAGLSPAARSRIELLLAAQLSRQPREQLRELRTVALLERVGLPAAREMLEALAGGGEGADLTSEARLALSRLRAAERKR